MKPLLGKEGSEVRLVFGKVMGFERVELLRVPTTNLTLVDPMKASWSGRTPDAEEVAIRPEPLANSSASEIITLLQYLPLFPSTLLRQAKEPKVKRLVSSNHQIC